jgi:iron complex outermembrane receptor protein
MNYVIMRHLLLSAISSFGLVLFALPSVGQQTISGSVTDLETGEPLIGTTIVLKGSTIGLATDADGTFEINSDQPFPWLIELTYTGYKTMEIAVEGPASDLMIQMEPGILLGSDIVISASRKSEKVTDSPASISVITDSKIQTLAKSGEPLELLLQTNGVQLNQQGIARSNITLRGASGVNQTTAQVLKDYRPLVNPGDYYLATARSTISDIDLEQIEVIRGPSGALYGPGVSAGVIHFLSKDPFKYPGTTVSLSAGERSVIKANIRHAGHNDARTFGYKVTAGYTSGNDWVLNEEDANDPEGGLSYGDNFVTESGDVLDIPGNLIEDFHALFVEGTLEFRPMDDLSIVYVTSMAENKGNDRITPGDMFRYWRVWNNQARVRYGNLFAAINYQVTPGTNGSLGSPSWTGQYAEVPGGSSFLYTDGDQTYLDAQVQYGFDVSEINTEFTVGGDYKSSIMDGNERNAGRFHEEDDYNIYGGYFQSNTSLIEDRLNLVLAARFDGFSAFDQTGFSPRIGLMYKPDETSQIRASYNRSFTPSGQVRAFLDFTIATTPWGKIQVLGSHAPITFNNPQTDFFPGFIPDGYNGVGSSLAPIYAFISNGPVAGAGLSPELLAYLQSQTVSGSTEGALNVFLPGGVLGPPVSNLKDLETDAAKLTMTQAYELGYKGVIGEKLAASIDLYFMKLQDFESDALGVSPFVRLPNLPDDLRNAILSGLDAQVIADLGGDINQIADIYANIAGNALGGPVGAVQTDQGQQVDGTQVNFGFQSIGNLSYWGMDFGFEYYLQTDLSAYLNYGYINQNVFSAEDISEVSGGYNLNTPQHKFRIGLNYLPSTGFFGGIHYLSDDAFMSTNGIYSGIAESRSLVNLNVGYNFGNGLKVSVNASNLFDNKYQAFPRLPEIGRLALFNVTYTFE